MYDLNFFSVPTKTKKRSAVLPIGILVILLTAGAIAGWYLWQASEMKDIQSDIDRMQAYLDAEPVNSQLAELEVWKQKTQLLQNYQTTFGLIDANLDASKFVSRSLLDQISATLPPGVAFQSMGINGLNLSIEGTAPTSLEAAELLHNLKASGLFTTVHLQQLTVESNEAVEEVLQRFTITATAKGVVAP